MTIFSSELNAWFQSRLLDEIPLNIAIIDRDYLIVYANEKFRSQFGEWANRKCYQVYKGLDEPCQDCQGMRTFDDGIPRKFEEVVGYREYYMVQTAPALDLNGNVAYIVAMSENITEIRNHQLECEIFFERVPCYIAVIDRGFNIMRANEKLTETFGDCTGKKCFELYKRRLSACEDCPAALSFLDGGEHTSTHVGISADGGETHYVVTTTPLIKGHTECKYVVEILTDITHIKALEKEKLDAERLAAVGQTVAGLAHSIKNILMGVEGGMYMVSSGIEKDDKARLSKGWDMLQRNISKVSSLVKDFLSFAKGRKPQAKLVNPNILIDEILELYAETANGIGVELKRMSPTRIPERPLDPDAIHTCLTNLVSNAIDACQLSTREKSTVLLGVYENDGTLVFEVADNGCGMDYDIQKKVFTTFFTTKGGKGTGLGLLTTYKIVQEHGGRINVESTPGEGSIFRILLPVSRLPEIT